MNEKTASHGSPNYLAIFGILCLLTVVSVLADVISLPGGKLVVGLIVLSVATAKAAYVLRYFMHLKYERAWKYALLLPTVILSIGLLLALFPDMAMHYYPQNVPQLKSQP